MKSSTFAAAMKLTCLALCALLLLLSSCGCNSVRNAGKDEGKLAPSAENEYRMAFWNLENLFDTIAQGRNDREFSPTGLYAWNGTRYHSKIEHLSRVILAMQPDALGVCEVENSEVIEDLLQVLLAAGLDMSYIHFDSPDERGIDVALLYNSKKLRYLNARPIYVDLPGKDETRSILHAQMITGKGDSLHIFVNHWPSRREGAKKSQAKRAVAGATLRDFLVGNSMLKKQVLIMGDLNDNPWDSSVRKVLGACRIANGASAADCRLLSLGSLYSRKGHGTLKFGKDWDFYDQFVITQTLFNGNIAMKYKPGSQGIFAPAYLRQDSGRYKGYPLRTFGGNKYLNGYSDHFPVYLSLTYASQN